MPFDCHIDPKRRLGIMTVRGTIDGAEIVAAAEALYGHPDWRRGFAVLWDGTGIKQLIVEPSDIAAIEELSPQMKPTMGSGRTAYVLPHETAEIIARLFFRRLPTPHRERRLFEHVDEALAWLEDSSDADEGR